MIIKNVYAQADWSDPSGQEAANFQDLPVIFENLLGFIIPLAGVVIFLMILVGGFKFMTSGGDPKKSEEAKGTLTWAIIGLLVLIGAWFILSLIKQFTGVDVTTFYIPE